MIEIRNLSKTFINPDGTRLQVLKNVNATVEEGQVISIIGPSGTGKSTLLRCINLLERPSGGEIIFQGRNILAKGTDIDMVRRRMGMVFQNFNLFGHMTILENVCFGPIRLLGMSKSDAAERAMKLLREVGLADKACVYPSSLSGGQKQRAAIARCLSMEPDCILFDEPTSALDPTMVGEVLSVMRQLAAKNMTMLIVTHEMKLAHDISNRIWFMDNGGILEDGTPQQIFENPVYDETRVFIQRLRSLHYDIDNENFDLYSINSDIDTFCLKYGVEGRRIKLQLLIEELLVVNRSLIDYSAGHGVSMDITYSELDYSLTFKALFKNVQHGILEHIDPISLSIIKGVGNTVTEQSVPEGMLIEIK